MRGLLNWWTQVISVTQVSLKTIPERLGSSLSAILGIAGVVAVLVGVLSIAQGVRRMVDNSADDDNAIVLRSGANTEMMSGLSGDDADVIAEAPGIVRDGDTALASSELFVIINLPKKSTGTDANVPLRGVVPAALEVRPSFDIVSGRMFDWGLNEVIVGVAAAVQFANLDVGDGIDVGGETWTVVGHFAANGGISEGEIWSDAAVLQPAYRRGNSYQAVYARLESPAAFNQFKDALTEDPRVNVKVLRESEYHSGQASNVETLARLAGSLIALFMALGAAFGALNTMYTAVSARTREIATLRALGFGSGPVVISILLESFLLSLIGGLIGGGAAYLAFDGFKAATINFASFSQISFAFDVTPSLLVTGIILALMIGFFGGLFPAWRAARMPVATALREQ